MIGDDMSDEVALMTVQEEISQMVFFLGLNSETQLCDVLKITQGAISKWKNRNSIPSKYQAAVVRLLTERIAAVKALVDINVTPEEVACALGMKKGSTRIYQYKKEKPYLYGLIEDGIRIEKVRAAELLTHCSYRK